MEDNESRIVSASNVKKLQCVCGNQVYQVLVEPQIKDGSAKLVQLVCANCHAGVHIPDDATVGKGSEVRTDALGRKHYRLKAEGGIFN